MKTPTLARLVVVALTLGPVILLAGQARAQKRCEIYSVEWPAEDNDFNTSAYEKIIAERAVTPLRHKSLTTLRYNVVQKATELGCDCISSLIIVGHGEAHKFSVGCGAYKTCTKDEYVAPDNKAQWEAAFRGVDQSIGFCKDALQSEGIYFFGCGIGICDPAAQLLYDLAQITYTHVRAVSDGTVDGPEIFDYLDGTKKDHWQVGKPGATSPESCKIGNWNAAPTRRREKKVTYHCPCDNASYSSLKVCTDSCRVSLGCYTNICTAEEDFDVWEEHSGNPVMSQGTSLAWNDAAVSSTTILRGGTTSGSAMA